MPRENPFIGFKQKVKKVQEDKRIRQMNPN